MAPLYPFVFTAACAAWVNIRLRDRLPFGDRELWFRSALMSLPGMVPTQEASSRPGERFRVETHLGNHLLRRVHAKPRDLRQPGHSMGMLLQGASRHLIEGLYLPVQQPQTFHRQFHNLHVNWFSLPSERVHQFFPTATKAVVAQIR
jgi:hypothetical protein